MPVAGWSWEANGSSRTATFPPGSRSAASSSTVSASWPQHLGVTATVGYNVDSFGHSGTLPQLLAASGLGSYVFMRPGPDEMAIAFPAFRWRGTDGTELPAYRIPYDYSTRGGHEDEVIRNRADELLAQSAALRVPLMAFFGVGDHGGGPTRLAMRTIHVLSDEHEGTVVFGDPAGYFDALAGPTNGFTTLPPVAGSSSGMPSAATRPGPTSSLRTRGPRTRWSGPKS